MESNLVNGTTSFNIDDIFTEIHGIFLNNLSNTQTFVYKSLFAQESILEIDLLQRWHFEYIFLANILMLIIVAGYASITTWEVNINLQASLTKIKEIIPRLVIGILMVNLSIYFCEFLITIHNLLINGLLLVAGERITEVLTTEPSNRGILQMDLILLMFLTISTLVLAFVIQGRQMLLLFLTLISPLSSLLWVVPETSSWFWMWLKEYITWALAPFFQVSLLVLSMSVLVKPLGVAGSIPGIITLIALNLLLAIVPFLTRTWIQRMFLKINLPGGYVI